MNILLTDGDQRSTLAAARALGSAGHAVYVADTSNPSLASRSRHCREGFAYPSPYVDEAGFIRAIDDAVRRCGIDLVIPMTDITSAVLAENRPALTSGVGVAVMDAETFWRASDKNALHRLAGELGIPHPTVRYVEGPGELEDPAGLPFPCIVKPSRSRLRTPAGWLKTAVLMARSREELDTWRRTKPELQHPFMLQRLVDGEGIGVFAICDRGEPRALFAHRRLREKPPSGGVSVLREAVPVDPVAGEYATRLLRALRWHGVAMVEFRKEHSTGIPYLMEVNGRFWGSLQLSIDAGLNFPVYLVKLWTGETIASNGQYRVGVRSRWLLGDLDHLLLRVTHSGDAPPGAPPLPRLLVDFCRFFQRDTRYEIESWRDPGPSFHEIRDYLRNLFTSGRHAH